MIQLATVVGALLALQDAAREETTAIVNVRILTVTKGEIASGTIVIKDGKIAEIGETVKPPPEARTIDAKGLVAFPGLVHPYTRITSPHRGGASGGSNPQVLAYDELSPASEALDWIARTGFTTLAIYPAGGTVAGQAVAIKPIGVTRDEMVIARTAYLRIDMEASTQAKDQLKRDYEAAKKAIEAAKKPAAPAPAPAAPPPPPGPAPAAPPPAAPKLDERTEVWVRHLKGELPAIVELATAAELLHFRQITKPFDEFKATVAYVLPPEAYKAVDRIAELKPRVILQPELTFLPFTRTRVNVAAEVARAGATIALAPADSPAAFEAFLFKVGELVKHGLDRDIALRAMTIVPAETLGLDKRVGSLEAGKDADILLLSGDPLSATTSIVKVLINGKVSFEP